MFIVFMAFLCYLFLILDIGINYQITSSINTLHKNQDGSFTTCERICSIKNDTRWELLNELMEIFTSVSAKYHATDGTLLMLFRNCSLGNSDMDFSIHQDWWKRPNNSKLLIDSLQSRGFQRSATFGNLDNIGYEESWMKNKIKVDIFSYTLNGSQLKSGFWINSQLHLCSYYLTHFS